MYADTINVGSVPDFESVCMSYVELEGEVGWDSVFWDNGADEGDFVTPL